MVSIQENILCIIHSGHGNAAAGAAITDAMRSAMSSLRVSYPRVAVYHDVSALESVGDDYVLAFARLAREWGNEGILYTAVIPKTWVRIFAKRASSLGGIKTHFFRSCEEAKAFLATHGFQLNLTAA